MVRLARHISGTVSGDAYSCAAHAPANSCMTTICAAMRACADDTAPGAHLGEWTDNAAFYAHGRLDAEGYEAWRP